MAFLTDVVDIPSKQKGVVRGYFAALRDIACRMRSAFSPP
ncbi:MAG: hypothetical protein QOJ99_6189, partial [Bryobacterales bacterium]|nr:hypothetical protein [Bryobacterales bacterium]